jgi:sodium pump decarboxylase gamma subunit
MLERILYSLELTVVGMSSVFAVLIFFASLIWFMKFLDAKVTENKIKKADKRLSTVLESIDDERKVIAAISAAINAATGKKSRIKQIQFLGHQPQEGKWASAGRSNVMSSHNLNKRS